MERRLGYRVTLALVLLAPALLAQAQSEGKTARRIAFRLDDRRVVFMLEELAERWPTSGTREEPERLPEPAAALAGMRLFAVDERVWREQPGLLPGGVQVGDAWLLCVTGTEVVSLVIEELALAQVGCARASVAIAAVAAADLDRYRRTRGKYYVALPAADYPRASERPPATPRRPLAVRLDAPERASLESVLDALMRRELPARLASLEETRRQAAASPHLAGWTERLGRLEAGQARLSLDLQAMRLGPRDDLLWFVRARWILDRRAVFLLSAWIEPGKQMRVVSVDSGWTEALWDPLFADILLGPEQLGLVLSVVDGDADGWCEVLLGSSGYEGAAVMLMRYTGEALEPAGVGFHQGC